MSTNFKILEPFSTRPPSLKDLVNQHVMGSVWVRLKPFGAVTDTKVISEKFCVRHDNILRALDKCKAELAENKTFNISEHFFEETYLAGPKTKKRPARKVDMTEFGLAVLLLYINSPKARQISAEILFRFFVLKTYLRGLKQTQIDALKGYYRQHLRD